MATIHNGGDDGLPERDASAVDFARYRARRLRLRVLDLLDALIVAIERRDLQAVWDLLDEEEAIRWFPDPVRNEALVIAQLPAASLRAPMRVYRFYHQIQQLADESLGGQVDTQQLALDLAPPQDTRPTIPFPERPAAPPDDPQRGGGTGHRRSGSR
jgi:hypothetical protein